MIIKTVKGTKDLLPQDSYKWVYVEGKLRCIANTFGFKEIRTPMFEETALFERGVGDTTDVVQKEMYTFEDKGGRSITLKPEGTAPVVRAFVENGIYADAQPTKMFYFTDAFRYEKSQKGRLRHFHQFGIEVFGSSEASIDAEGIALAIRSIKDLGVDELSLNINSLGCPHCRKNFNDALKAYLKENYQELCETCKTRFEKNPMRILDCKEKTCKEISKGAPIILDFLCEECKEHFEQVKIYLDALHIKYVVDPYIVRGLDYYTKTVFEVINNADGLTICGGGRYDGLIEELGGPSMPAFGFGMGMERLIMVLEAAKVEIPEPVYMDLYIGSMSKEANMEAFKICSDLRKMGIKCEVDHMKRSVKAQMKYANKNQCRFSLIIGDEELENKQAKLKRMSDGEIFSVQLDYVNYIYNKIIKD
ncbi:histidyl-tRNA synthetase [Hathewaya proteolytica DSM 3090]|uniref:Histidine--tRNA ligase n=1 Tax=Hathewaya proteolytica DSM 3090 TaxID=1121331 RepID=A0A1M6P7Q2_9CLOT|nr:histidine--tRNA ligase [Hathewaya proteolytica]SHK03968.1 histidyl-tRNA synthetase [Hathewaya proteolytica DSM 3090]